MLPEPSPRTTKETLLWFLRRRRRVQVRNKSMMPTLVAGDQLLVNPRAYHYRRPQLDDIVIALNPQEPQGKMIKRITAVFEDGSCFLEGDNPYHSTDSRHFGPIPSHYILGKVTCYFAHIAS